MNLTLLYAVIFTIVQTDCKSRKYDVELEARKIYGQHLKSVLERFRRTPDYIQILNIEKQKLEHTLLAYLESKDYYYELRLREKVNEIINENITDTRSLRHRTTPGEYYTLHMRCNRKPIIRQHTHNMSRVERLEQYLEIYPYLPLDIRNRMIDLGFEFFGYILHGAIKSMVPFENSMSTLQVLDSGSNFLSTHYSHKITSTKGDTGDKDETFRSFKQKAGA